MITSFISQLFVLSVGTLYPAYASYKTVQSRNSSEYPRWLTHWIIFALYTSFERFSDAFLGFWFPFYSELKMMLTIWLFLPESRGADIMYRNFVQPLLSSREQDIDNYITKSLEYGANVVRDMGSGAFSFMMNAVVTTAMKGGNGLIYHLKKSYSLNDLYTEEMIKSSSSMIAISKSKTDCCVHASHQKRLNKSKSRNDPMNLLHSDDCDEPDTQIRRRRETRFSQKKDNVVCNGTKNGVSTRNLRSYANRKSTIIDHHDDTTSEAISMKPSYGTVPRVKKNANKKKTV